MNLSSDVSAEAIYREFIQHARALAEARGVIWEFTVDASGRVPPGELWNLRKMRNEPSLTPLKLPPLAHFPAVESVPDPAHMTALATEWQDLLKAMVVRAIFVDRHSCTYVVALTQALRTLATVAKPLPPWEVSASHAQTAVARARAAQRSGKAGHYVQIVCQRLFDRHSLSAHCPIGVFPRATARSATKKAAESALTLGTKLADRKSAEKLPDRRAFWELQRIIWTETPASFHDFIRFAMLRVITLTGLRIGECARLPADWRRTVEYFDVDGTPADRIGGVREAVKLRYFAEKQDQSDRPLGALIEEFQWVPRQFESAIAETLESVLQATAPLRETLRAQCASRRLLPQYARTDLVPALDVLQHLTGTSVIWRVPRAGLVPLLSEYRMSYDPAAFDALDAFQARHGVRVTTTVPRYMNLLRNAGVGVYSRCGAPWHGVRKSYEGFVRVDEVEDYAARSLRTKLPDTTPFAIADGGQLQPWELLFLHPKRALGEGRDGNPCHTGKYAFVGVVAPESVMNVLGEGDEKVETLFERYGRNDRDRALVITSHALRHLLNTDLFRLGLSDALITKHFGRTSVAQSYEYDHRSLGETLRALEVPRPLEERIGPNAAFVATLIANNLVTGPIVSQFEHFQATEGEDAALAFLAAEADGFHVTPYGFCLRSFSAAPCPKHLECFNDCLHATATGLPEHTRSLETLQHRIRTQLEAARAHPADTVGRANQIQHAEQRLKGIRKFLAAQPNSRVFPDGVDRSRRLQRETPLDV